MSILHRNLISPSGPEDAPGLLVGEAGGETEHYRKRPFCGKAGGVLNTYLNAAGIARPDVRVTNVFPFWTGPGNPDPTKAEIEAEEWRLEEEIRRLRPRVIGAVGRVAARWFLGDVDLDSTHGIPHFSKRAPNTVVVPIYHPASGFYKPELAAYSQEDFFAFAYFLKNPVTVKAAPKISVKLVTTMPSEIRNAAVDTEGSEDRPWGLSWSFDGYHTHVFIWDGKPITTRFSNITFHNALHDLKILRAMGVDTSNIDYHDTMVKLYLRQLEPQGLKAAAYRHLGLRMNDFDDVVRPHFNRQALDYFTDALKLKYEKPAPIPVEDYSKRKWRLYKPWDAGRRIKSILTSWTKRATAVEAGTVKDDDKPIKLEKKWSDLGEEFQEQIEWKMGGKSFPEFSIFCVPKNEAVTYSGIDAGATKLIDPHLDRLLDEKGLRPTYEMDRRYLPFVDRMQETGLRVDVQRLRDLEVKLTGIKERARDRVQRVVGDRWFNPGSDDQVSRWLYKVRGIPILKYTDSGESGSTSLVTMKMIQGYYGKDYPDVLEFASALREYKECEKYLGTFIEPVFEHMRRDRHGDWRVHPNYRVTRVVSGRNSSHDPNVMAFPTRTDLGKLIRRCFAARPGYVIVCVDASQIELRMMAHHCRDRRMREAFEAEIDLHSLTASIIFKVPIEKFRKPRSDAQEAQRYVAKTINFAVMYGITAPALLEQLYKADIFDYTLQDCENFILEWFKIYGSVRRFLEQVWLKAGKDGFVRDMWGRMCYVPNLRVGDQKMRESAKRLAGNMPIQGGARGLVKRGQIRTHEWLLAEGLYDDEQVRPWLDMHDEVDLEVREDLKEVVTEQVKRFFCADQDMIRVPLKADGGWGQSWGEAKAA